MTRGHSLSGTEKGQERARLVRVMTDEGPRWGFVAGDQVREVQGDPLASWSPGAPLMPLEGAPLLAPTVPSKIICIGLNYAAHAEESETEVPPDPLLFFKPPSAVIGSGAPIVLPPESERVDYEAELAIVIGRVEGRTCRHVSPEEAWNFVLGATCGNDVTARDLQRRDHQWTRAKGFDTFCPLGPWLVTGLGEEDVRDVEITCRVNGEVRQQGRASDMILSPAELIAYASSIMTLEPGDVIMTGTPEGIGPLSSGDSVEVQVGSVGTLQNPVRSAR